ncbi:bifunctional 23S rRNA (guanine(2069)-N(7))-methyltransferase RlmK/23S rRNA (guanine(2445)-N(2))-methyltransferase RlmL [Marinobacter zhanjiangensis]|uniref:Ribosomal RNA large subunit methyltransferase K/L n=1 Tax=Marinobacter zhanjiangensis TaxID=578215 RepID=A0ABQ3ARG3_9GAMM|nr:bifunctional 23S rRNA (guanine(2069)-N(7))-methyltransferase RlmK/23S rRNA (guanine(2445)-N(2))-methyltransferase RlmL [Marinobacter zhanjiangensis]GGY65543.1 ribosomal RNA large subunit methyltransferase K/L [Marinobacter zhanjiangensis]
MAEHYEYFVTCPRGIDGLLQDELESFGLKPLKTAPAGVWVQGGLAEGYRACLWSRLANRVLLHLATVDARSNEALYQGVYDIPWEDHLKVDGKFRVMFAGTNELIRNTQYGGQKVKDAVVDRLRGKGTVRPSVDSKDPDITLSARLHRGQMELAIDLSGDSLHMRGYRTEKGIAPVRENLASALLLRSGWPKIADNGGDFIDPMCGSGTLVIEAALMALDQAPGRLRPRFGFERWLGHQPELWLELRQEAERRAWEGKQGRLPRFTGYDQDSRVIATAWRNIARAGLEGLVHVEARPVEDFHRDNEWGNEGLVLVNPPYGERLSDRKELGVLYQQLGERVREHLPGWRLGVFTGVPELGHAIGLRSHRQYRLFNGKLPAQLLLFEINDDNTVRPRDVTPPGEVRAKISHPERAQMLENRLKKNLKTLGQWARKQNIQCYRLYDADMPEFALAIDVYGDHVHVQEYAAPKSIDEKSAQERLSEAMAVIPEVLGVPVDRVICKQRQRQTGTRQYEKQDASGEFMEVDELGSRLKVNLRDYLDTGLFLDHRPVRRWIRDHARNKRFLNLFCYTGAATVQAVAGGASRSLSLDMSNTYVEWARDNLALNGADPDRHRVEPADCVKWLADKPSADQRFDLIFMDPPTFSNSARMRGVLDVQRDHGMLIRQAMARLTGDGLLIFSTNFRRFKLDEDLGELYELEDVTASTLDRDFQRNSRIHQCWHIQHKA